MALFMFVPVAAWASGGSSVTVAADFTTSIYGYLGLLLFILAYTLVTMENKLHLRKSKPVLFAAGIIWVLVALAYAGIGDTHTAHDAIKASLLEYAELFLFLLAAMTYINALEERNVFQSLRAHLVSRGYSFKMIFWITGILSFCISPIADNLTTALLMGAVIMAVGGDNKSFIAIACINVIVAANAGGAFSPFGDITTLMVWQKGKIEFTRFFLLLLPSLINWLIPAFLMSFAVESSTPTVTDEQVSMKKGAHRIMILFLMTIATAVSFHNFLNLPPAAGMMLGLGYLGIFSFFLKKMEGVEERFDSILGTRSHETLHPIYNLVNQQSNLSAYINDFEDPTFMIDSDHLVTHWNPAMEKLSGVKAKDVIGTSRHWYPFYRRERLVLADLVLENFSKKEIGRHYHGHHKPIANMKHAYEAAAFFPDLSGGRKWLSIAAALVRDDNETIIGVVETLRDHTKQKQKASHFDIMKRIARAEWDTLLFFYGVILCVGGLSQFGYLGLVSGYLYTDLGATVANTLLGVVSAVIDNIPVMLAVLMMDPSMSEGQWLLITLTAGTGGSLLAIGSAAGVALMGSARGIYTFGSHLKWAPAIAVGYAASIALHIFINGKLF
jgi:PAS domain S-box-containing protein